MKIFKIQSLFKLPDDFTGNGVDALQLMAKHVKNEGKKGRISHPLAHIFDDAELFSEFQNQLDNEEKLCFYTYNFYNFSPLEITPTIIEQNAKIVNSVPCPRCKAVGKDCVNSKGQPCKNPHNVRIGLCLDMKDKIGNHSVRSVPVADGTLEIITEATITEGENKKCQKS